MSAGVGSSYAGVVNEKSEAYVSLGGGPGQVEFWIVATDNLGNSAQNTPTPISILNCPG
jgi:hypothetical protein